MHHSKVKFTGVLALLLMAVFGCKKTTAPATSSSNKEIVIGHYGSMTGSEATFGQSTEHGIMLAVKEQNAAGGVNGKPVKLITYDTAGKTQEAGTAVTRLITSDHVTAVLGEVASSLSIAGGRVAQQYGVPMISPSSTNAQVTQIGDKVFRVCFIDAFQGYVVAKFARDTLKVQKAAILFDQAQAYSKGLKDDFRKAFTELGGTIVDEQAYTGGDQDFGAQLNNMKATAPEAVFIPGYYTDVGNIAIQARKLGLKQPLLGGDGWDSDKLVEIGGTAVENTYYSTHYSNEDTRPEVRSFVDRYKSEYKQIPDGLAASGYDAAKILFDAMKRAPDLSGAALAKAIGETKNFPGVTGVISIDENRNARKPAVVMQIKNGKPSFFASIEPREPQK